MAENILIQVPQSEKDLLKVSQDNFYKLRSIFQKVGRVETDLYSTSRDPGKVKIAHDDVNADYLGRKLTAGTGITLTPSTGADGKQTLVAIGHVPVTLATDSGLSLSGQELAMGTPSTCTDETTNAIIGDSHTHQISVSGAGGGGAELLEIEFYE